MNQQPTDAQALLARTLIHCDQEFTLPGPGRIILHSIILSAGEIDVFDGNNACVTRIAAQPLDSRLTGTKHRGTNQIHFDVVLDLPLRVKFGYAVKDPTLGVTIIFSPI